MAHRPRRARRRLDASGHTLFWAELAKPVAWVRAYDADGALIAEHRLRACEDPVDCEVR